MRLLLAAVVGALIASLAACASMGRPEGGPRDVEPPVFVKGNPAANSTNAKKSRIALEFDENVTIGDIMTKVVISPAQRTMPQITAVGRHVNIELRDTLLDSTTYTIDFTDAIKDLNEGNPLDGFSYAFSTGPFIDSLQISGMVFEAANLEPAQGMLVGVYSNLSDTAITTLPLDRITRTNQYGQFTLRNLKEGTYRIFAIDDVNRDYHWDRSENVAFYDMTITPSSSPTMVKDTIEGADGRDSIVERPATAFLPNDILLTWFNEDYKSQYLMTHDRKERNKIYIEMGAPSDTLPQLTILNGRFAGDDLSRWSVLNASATLDTLEYWLSDSTLITQDSLFIAARHLQTDSLDRLVWTTDTLRFIMRGAKSWARELENREKARKKLEEEYKHVYEERERMLKDNVDSLTLARFDAQNLPKEPEKEYLGFRATTPTSHDLNQPLIFSSPEPIIRFDSTAVHLEMMDDSIWVELEPPALRFISPTSPMKMIGEYEWIPDTKYRLTIDSNAVEGVYVHDFKRLSHEFTTKKPEDYSSIIFNISGIDSLAVVQLLNTSDVPVAAAAAEGNRVQLDFITPGTYYARLFIDANGNGKYDTGNLLDSIQPEEVYYYPKKITLKQYWTWEQAWNVNELPIDQQKPNEIKKNKPKKKPGETEPAKSDEDEEDDTFGNGRYGSTGTNRPGGMGSGNNNFTGAGGFRTAQ